MREEREMENAFRRRNENDDETGTLMSKDSEFGEKNKQKTPNLPHHSAPSATPTLTGNLLACIIRSRR